MKTLLSKIERVLTDAGKVDSADILSESMLRHCIDRSTLPRDVNIRRAIFAVKSTQELEQIDSTDLLREFKQINGVDLYNAVSDIDLKEDIDRHLSEGLELADLKVLQEFLDQTILKVLENYKYRLYSEEDYIKTILILNCLTEPTYRINRHKDDKKTSKKIIDRISKSEWSLVEKRISIDVPLSKIKEIARVEGYRAIIKSYLTIKRL